MTTITTTVDPGLMDWLRFLVAVGPVLQENERPASQKYRKKAIAVLNRIEKGTATDAEQAWFAEFIVAVERARKN